MTSPTYNGKPRIVFCTTCKGRAQHIKETLPSNLLNNAGYHNCKFVLLDYGDASGLREYVQDWYAGSIKADYLTVYDYRAEGPFHMAHAKNMAARCGILEGADVLVTLDADNLTGPGFAGYIADTLRPGSFICPDFPRIHAMPHGPDRPPRGYAGRLAVRAQDFIKAGGYDMEFDTWRGEDIDMMCRLQRMGYAMQTFDNRFLNAVRHNADIRFLEYPHAKQYEDEENSRRELDIIAARTETVVNRGNIGVGTVRRNYKDVVYLAPLPARVFGVGLHKTATTSLDQAFRTLGFDSFHFNTGNEARLIWEQMNSPVYARTIFSSGIKLQSPELERWYALCDLPIPLLYRQLDEAYPGSKFVLTVRGEDGWLNSVRKLWSYDHNPHLWTWDVYPFSNRIHTALYGTQHFDAGIFLERYRRHNAEVRAYFRNRPGDLLVMDMDANAGWDELCGFLNMPKPGTPYPRLYRTEERAVAALRSKSVNVVKCYPDAE